MLVVAYAERRRVDVERHAAAVGEQARERGDDDAAPAADLHAERGRGAAVLQPVLVRVQRVDQQERVVARLVHRVELRGGELHARQRSDLQPRLGVLRERLVVRGLVVRVRALHPGIQLRQPVGLRLLRLGLAAHNDRRSHDRGEPRLGLFRAVPRHAGIRLRWPGAGLLLLNDAMLLLTLRCEAAAGRLVSCWRRGLRSGALFFFVGRGRLRPVTSTDRSKDLKMCCRRRAA